MASPSWLPRPATIVGLCAAVVGVISGIVIGTRNPREGACPDGVNPADGVCRDYPNAADGVAVVAISVMLAVLIVLVASNQSARTATRE